MLYVKGGCHLCAEADALLDPLLRQAGRSVRRVDINNDPEAARLYALRVPVLTAGRRELCAGRFDPAALRVLLGLPPAPRRWPWGRP